MLTLVGDDAFRDAAARRHTAEQLLSFAGLKVSHDLLDSAEATFARDVAPALDAALSASFDDANGAADATLKRELATTNGLRAWPCRSLWVDGEDAVIRASAAALAPNCSSAFTTCSVPKDRQEMAGRGPADP
jgi:hypothetical protein